MSIREDAWQKRPTFPTIDPPNADVLLPVIRTRKHLSWSNKIAIIVLLLGAGCCLHALLH